MDTNDRRTMVAARLHGPGDLRVETMPHPGSPGPGEVLLRVTVTGICGSDLHSYEDARIGDTRVEAPLVLGHEFSAVVEEAGAAAQDASGNVIQPGTHVAVDPARPCMTCELCQHGHPNLCCRLHFCGCAPDDGSLSEWIRMPSHCCYTAPEKLDDEELALLEPLGVALHAVDLARVRVGQSMAIVGAGPIGLLCLQVARLAGAGPVFISDKFPWRLRLAEAWGGIPVSIERGSAVEYVGRETRGRGVDRVIEAAWGDEAAEQAAELARLGGRVVLVGIPRDDRLAMRHSTARRKGLTIVMSRRMKHVYPRAITLASGGLVHLRELVSHRFSLRQAPEAFRLSAAYEDEVIKAMVSSRV